MYELLLAIHLLAVVSWAGGTVMLHILGRRAVKRGRAAALAWAREANWVGSRVFGGLAVVVLVAGILLVGEAGYEHSQAWVSIAYGGWLTLLAIGAAAHPRLHTRTEQAATEHGKDSAEAHAAVGRTLALSTFEVGVLLLIVIDMAVKPGT